MRIRFDNGTPNLIPRSLVGDEVAFARHIGWHELKNGELLGQAEVAGYELLLTSDKNMLFQQNLSGRMIAIVVLGNQQWPDVKLGKNSPIGAGLTNPLGRRLDHLSNWRSCKSQSQTFQIYFRHPNR